MQCCSFIKSEKKRKGSNLEREKKRGGGCFISCETLGEGEENWPPFFHANKIGNFMPTCLCISFFPSLLFVPLPSHLLTRQKRSHMNLESTCCCCFCCVLRPVIISARGIFVWLSRGRRKKEGKKKQSWRLCCILMHFLQLLLLLSTLFWLVRSLGGRCCIKTKGEGRKGRQTNKEKATQNEGKKE